VTDSEDISSDMAHETNTTVAPEQDFLGADTYGDSYVIPLFANEHARAASFLLILAERIPNWKGRRLYAPTSVMSGTGV
jgi:hypothetical protein